MPVLPFLLYFRLPAGSNPFFLDIRQRNNSVDSESLEDIASGTSNSVPPLASKILHLAPPVKDFGPSVDTENLRQPLAPSCVKCGVDILDRYLVRIRGRVWHENCAVCSICSASLPNFCFVINSQLFCRQDYHRLYATKCATCRQPMLSHELCMRAGPNPWSDHSSDENIHHVSCFVCSICRLPLAAGDPYTYHPDTGALLCKPDYLQLSGIGDASTGSLPAKDTLLPTGSASTEANDLSASTFKRYGSTPRITSPSELFSMNAKRGRTTLSLEQRCHLQDVFDTNSRPSRKYRDSLAKEMNLPVRVIQVWFQNQRAREKKIASSIGSNNHSDLHPSSGIASSNLGSNSELDESSCAPPAKVVIRRQPNSSNWQHTHDLSETSFSSPSQGLLEVTSTSSYHRHSSSPQLVCSVDGAQSLPVKVDQASSQPPTNGISSYPWVSYQWN